MVAAQPFVACSGLSIQAEITLWGAGTSRTMRPVWLAEELGIRYQLKPIGPRTGETQTPEFKKLNPKQKIPLLVSGELRLSESLAICRYLITAFPGDVLYTPQSIDARAQEDEWCCYIYGELDETSLYVMRRHGDLAHIYGDAPEVVRSAGAYAVRHLEVIAHRMGERPYVLAQGFGLADIMLMTCLDWAVAYQLMVPAGLMRYREGIAQRPAYLRAKAINFAHPI
ncbi:MAG: glutathione S-transferase family protein [bacterium]